MVGPINLTAASYEQLQKRHLTRSEINDFESLLNEAAGEMRSDGLSARQVIQQMDTGELHLLQKASSLASSIKPEALSEEGAINLLRQPDNSDRIDLNNDGLVEVGEGKMIVFPPVNAPDFVKHAWNQASETMSERDKAFLQLHMHTAIYGIHIDGMPSRPAPSPAEQWSDKGISELLTRLRDNLEFEARRSGWSDYLREQEEFYNRFETALG